MQSELLFDDNKIKGGLMVKQFYRFIFILEICCTISVLQAMVYQSHEISWQNRLSEKTLKDSWLIWDRDFRPDIKPTSVYADFVQACERLKYCTMTVDDFLQLNVENHRLGRYIHAKTPEEFYPIDDRPRQDNKDVQSVRYHMTTQNLVSPICVICVDDQNGHARKIKLDGSHRLVAAKLCGSHICVCFISLCGLKS